MLEKFVLKVAVPFFLLIYSSCAIGFRSGMMNAKYPTDIFWDKDEPKRPYEILGDVKMQKESYYTSEKRRKKQYYGDLPKGYSYDEKEIMIFHLSKKAKEMGADAIMRINYQVFVSQDKYGYDLSALAIKYK